MAEGVGATVRSLSARALADVDALVEALLEVLVAAEPAGFHDEESVDDLRVAVRGAVTRVLQVLGGDDAGDLYDVAREAGRRQLQQALPLEGVLRSYRTAGQAVWEHFVALAQADDAPVSTEILHGASEVWRVIDRFCTAAAEAYRREEGLLRERDVRVQGAVLTSLLDGRGADPLFARDATQALGLPPTGPYVCVVGLPDRLDELALDRPGDRLRMGRVASAWTSVGGADVGLVALGDRSASEVRRLVAATVRSRAGMSPAFDAITDLPRARHLADTAARCPGTPRSVRVLEEDLLAALAVEAPLVSAMLYERTVGRLLAEDDHGDEGFLVTVRVFLECGGSVAVAAERSFLHRNTIIYRLNRVEALTGVSARELDGQLLWMLALKQHDARQDAPAVRAQSRP